MVALIHFFEDFLTFEDVSDDLIMCEIGGDFKKYLMSKDLGYEFVLYNEVRFFNEFFEFFDGLFDDVDLAVDLEYFVFHFE